MMLTTRKRKAPASNDSKRRIAAAIGARMRARYPYSSFGTAHVQRGTPENLERFGQTYRSASAEQKNLRKQVGYYGRGEYIGRGGFFGDIGSRIGDLFGRGHGDMGKAGRNIGEVADSLFDRFGGKGLYTGRGAYDHHKNELMFGSANRSAQISSAGDETGSIMISNREYVGDIFAPSTTGTFDVSPFPLNPGLEQTFPWLSQLAANYEEYEFHQLIFEFRSSIQDVNSANGQVGTIITCTNYNASLPLYPDKPTMAAAYGSISGKTVADQTHGVECDPNKLSGAAGSYVRTNPVLVGEDLKQYDHGVFQLATHNIPSSMLNGTLGELYVCYKVMLRKPKLLTARGLNITRALFVSGGSESNTLPFGTQALLLSGQQNNFKVAVTISSNQTVLTFPAYWTGSLEIKVTAELAVYTGNLISGTTLGGNVTSIKDIYADIASGGDAPNNLVGVAGTTGTITIFHIRVQPATNAVNNTFTMTHGLTAGTVSQSCIDICEYNTSFNSLVTGAPVLVNSGGTVVVP